MAIGMFRPTRIAHDPVPRQQRRPERPSGVARRRLNPKLLKGPVPQELSIRYAIEGNASGKAQAVLSCFAVDVAGHAHHHFFCHFLDAGR